MKQSVNILEVIGSRSIKEKNISAVELNQLKQNSKRAKLKKLILKKQKQLDWKTTKEKLLSEKVIEEKTNLQYEISIHKKEDIEKVKESLPKLSALVGALTLH